MWAASPARKTRSRLYCETLRSLIWKLVSHTGWVARKPPPRARLSTHERPRAWEMDDPPDPHVRDRRRSARDLPVSGRRRRAHRDADTSRFRRPAALDHLRDEHPQAASHPLATVIEGMPVSRSSICKSVFWTASPSTARPSSRAMSATGFRTVLLPAPATP
jgi:hypothetical protein